MIFPYCSYFHTPLMLTIISLIKQIRLFILWLFLSGDGVNEDWILWFEFVWHILWWFLFLRLLGLFTKATHIRLDRLHLRYFSIQLLACICLTLSNLDRVSIICSILQLSLNNLLDWLIFGGLILWRHRIQDPWPYLLFFSLIRRIDYIDNFALIIT